MLLESAPTSVFSYCFAAVNLCKQNNGGCHKNGKCTQIGVKVFCSCQKGYKGDGYVCLPINLCADGYNGGCHEHAICTMTGPVSLIGNPHFKPKLIPFEDQKESFHWLQQELDLTPYLSNNSHFQIHHSDASIPTYFPRNFKFSEINTNYIYIINKNAQSGNWGEFFTRKQGQINLEPSHGSQGLLQWPLQRQEQQGSSGNKGSATKDVAVAAGWGERVQEQWPSSPLMAIPSEGKGPPILWRASLPPVAWQVS